MNEKVIWDFLLRYVENAYGTAAIMGNLMAESSLNPKCVTGTKDPDYVEKADAGTIDFIHDGHAFGLAQWCFWSRKEKLFNYAKERGQSIGELNMQLDFLWSELQNNYPQTLSMMKSATSIREASDAFMTRYEKPGDQSETMKKRRSDYGQKFFQQFVKIDPVPSGKKMVVATENVRIRSGDSIKYGQVGRLEKGQSAEWVATSNGFHGIRMKDRVGWVSGDFSKVVS